MIITGSTITEKNIIQLIGIALNCFSILKASWKILTISTRIKKPSISQRKDMNRLNKISALVD
jgi:hypothetical protein